MATPTGVALLAELEGMAQRHMPKKNIEPSKPNIEIDQVLDFDEIFSLFKMNGYPNTAKKVIAVLAKTGFTVVKLK